MPTENINIGVFMSFGNVLLFSSSVVFGAAFLLKIDASKKLIKRISDDRANYEDLNSFFGSIRSFHNKNREGCMKFYFSNAALLVSGFVYDGSAMTKIFGLCAFGASLYNILSLKTAFQDSKPFTRKAAEAATNLKGKASEIAGEVGSFFDDAVQETQRAATSSSSTSSSKKSTALSKGLDRAEEYLENSAFGRLTDKFEDGLEKASNWFDSLFSNTSSNKKGGRG